MLYVETIRGVNMLNKNKKVYKEIFLKYLRYRGISYKREGEHFFIKFIKFYNLLEYHFKQKKIDVNKFTIIASKLYNILIYIQLKVPLKKEEKTRLKYLLENIRKIKYLFMRYKLKDTKILLNDMDTFHQDLKITLEENINIFKNKRTSITNFKNIDTIGIEGDYYTENIKEDYYTENHEYIPKKIKKNNSEIIKDISKTISVNCNHIIESKGSEIIKGTSKTILINHDHATPKSGETKNMYQNDILNNKKHGKCLEDILNKYNEYNENRHPNEYHNEHHNNEKYSQENNSKNMIPRDNDVYNNNKADKKSIYCDNLDETKCCPGKVNILNNNSDETDGIFINIEKSVNEIVRNFCMIKSIIKIYSENSKKFLNKFTIYEADKIVDSIDLELYNCILKIFYEKIKSIINEIKNIMNNRLNSVTSRLGTRSLKFCELFNIDIKEIIKNDKKYIMIISKGSEIIFSYLSIDCTYDTLIDIIDSDIFKTTNLIKLVNANILIINQDLQILNSIKSIEYNNIDDLLAEVEYN